MTYGFGDLVLGFFIDGRNTKRVISALLVASGIASIGIGAALAAMHNPYSVLILL